MLIKFSVMKKVLSVIAIIALAFCTLDANAQMSKQEQKQWKKRIKALSPEQYKTLLEQNKSLSSQVSSLKSDLDGVDDRIAEKDNQISTYQEQVSDLRSQLSAAKQAAESNQGNTGSSNSGSNIDENVGVVFKVQIGAFKNKDLTKFLQVGKNFSGEVDENGLKRYSLGIFKDYWEADTFKKYLREMGVKDAWIVSFKDGKRVPIKDVLEGVI